MKTRVRIALLSVLNAGLATIVFFLARESLSSLRLGERRAAFDNLVVVLLIALLLAFFTTMLVKACRGESWPKK